MSWSNQNKDTTTFANQAKGSESLTWDEATFTWDEATGTWDDPYSWQNQNKDSTAFTNQNKS